MRSRPLMSVHLDTAPTQNLGAGPHGTRILFPITGGSFEGDRLRGKVLPGGADWAIQRADGVVELDLRSTLQTDDGALISMILAGMRDDRRPETRYRLRTGRERNSPRVCALESEVAQMLWTLAVLLLVLWVVGLFTAHTMGGLLHILLVLALVVLVIRLVQGRRGV